MRPSTKTTHGRWNRSASTSDLPTIAFFRASTLLRRNGPVPGILATHWPGAIMDKSGLRFVAHLIDRTTKKPSRKNQLKDAELQFRPVHSEGSRQVLRLKMLCVSEKLGQSED